MKVKGIHPSDPNPYTLLPTIPGDYECLTVLDLKDPFFCIPIKRITQFQRQEPTVSPFAWQSNKPVLSYFTQNSISKIWLVLWLQKPSFWHHLATHSSTLAWKIPWAKEPGRLQSMGSLRVGHDWATSLSLSCFKGKLTTSLLPRVASPSHQQPRSASFWTSLRTLAMRDLTSHCYLLNPGIEPMALMGPALVAGFFTPGAT